MHLFAIFRNFTKLPLKIAFLDPRIPECKLRMGSQALAICICNMGRIAGVRISWSNSTFGETVYRSLLSLRHWRYYTYDYGIIYHRQRIDHFIRDYWSTIYSRQNACSWFAILWNMIFSSKRWGERMNWPRC